MANQDPTPSYYDIVELFSSPKFKSTKIRELLDSDDDKRGDNNNNKSKGRDSSPEKWYDKKIMGLDDDGIARLNQLKSDVRRGASHVDRKQILFLETLKDLQMKVPPIFKQNLSAKELYKKLKSFCDENDIPSESIKTLLPSLIQYGQTGSMRGIILVGPPGSGKTTCFRKLLDECLGLPVEVIKVPQAGTSHGIYGDAGTYQSASCGCICMGRLKHRSLIVAYLFDEIDKCASGSNRISISDELLSVNDDSVKEFHDTYIEARLPGLEHSLFLFTCNDLSRVSPILADRCQIIYFPSPNSIRIKSICHKYVEKKLSLPLYSVLEWNYELMNESIDNLINKEITSIRKHQQLIESVMASALDEAFNQDSDEPIRVTRAMFETAEMDILGIANQKRKVGFG